MESIAVYIHVPYCRVLCPYCDFVKAKTLDTAPDAFVEALCDEIRNFEGPTRAGSVSLGGGTPSLLKPESLARIFDTLGEKFNLDDPETSIEVNPDDVTADSVQAWRDVGINRVSLGVQSFDDAVLRFLGRLHNAERARAACGMVAEHFDNWAMDLIFGAQPTNAWTATLDECIRFDPPHVSTYGLTYEEGTPFWKRRGQDVDEDASLELYQKAMAKLQDYGHYEVSNFAKPGFESAHNQVYWRNDEYAGFGPGAYSFLGDLRSRNAPSIRGYLERPGEKAEALKLSEREIKVETLIQHFRTRAGLPRERYETRFGCAVEADFFQALDALKTRGLIELRGDSIAPTQRGYELNNEIGLAMV